MISGYFLIDKPLKSRRLLMTIVPTIFYCFGLNVVMKLMGYPISIYDFAKSLFPFGPTVYNYWFITRYLTLMALLPFMSILSRTLTKKKHLMLLGLLLILLSSVTSFLPGLSFASSFNEGTSVWWFTCLFFTGGYLSKYVKITNRRSKLIVIVLAFSFIVLLKFGVFDMLGLSIGYNGLIPYCGSILILLMFLFIQIPSDTRLARIITWASPTVFAIYLIHEQHHFSQFCYQLARDLIHTDNRVLLGTELTAYCLACFVAMILVDKIREYIFEKAGINKAILHLSERIDTSVNRWIHS
jgi:surface polysaccharide O-acyltransferase-like enzyme